MPNITHKGWTLHYTIGDVVAAPVQENDIVTTADGDELRILSGTSPHKVNSTGRVYVESVTLGWKQEFFPSVIGARWVSEVGGLGG